jgi:transposase-like protein
MLFNIDREHRMDYEIKNVKMEDEFKVCPYCEYRDGFHSMFKKVGDVTKWLFICPSCHEVFDIGYTV